jgi:hypothetical protein
LQRLYCIIFTGKSQAPNRLFLKKFLRLRPGDFSPNR